MKPGIFKLISTFGDRKRVRIWDSSNPMAIDQEFKWILENDQNEPRVRYLSGKSQTVESDRVIAIPSSSLETGSAFKLPQDLLIQLKRLRPIPPAYVSNDTLNSTETRQLLVFSGSGRALVSSEVIPSAYVAYSRGKPVFILQSSAEGFQLRPLLPGVRLKLKNQESLPGQVEETWKLSSEQLAHCTIVRASRWWRFNFTEIPASTQELFKSQGADERSRLFRNLLIGFLIFTLGIGALVLKMPRTSKSLEEEPEKPVVKFVSPKAKLIVQEKPPEPIALAKPVEKPSPPQETKAPKKAEAKPAPAPAPKTPAKAPAPDPAIAAQAASAKKMAALRDVLGSAMTLTKKTTSRVSENIQPSTNNNNLFNSKTNVVKPTEIKPGYAGDNSKVEGIGGGKSGSGYAGHQGVATGAGGGGSFVSVGSGGVAVEKGLLAEEVGAVIHSHMDEVRYCHESAMLYKPNLNGKLIVQFSISPTGVVEKANPQSSTLGDPRLEDCIIKKLVKWRFPKPKGGIHVAVSYPFIFKVLGHE